MSTLPKRPANLMTPARVRALCLLSCDYHLDKKTMAGLFQPKELNKDTKVFDGVYQCATSLELIHDDEKGLIHCNLSKEVVEDTVLFRRAVIKGIMKEPEQIFCCFTAWYLQRGENAYKESSLEKAFFEEVKIDEKNAYNDTNINAWRTWASFLGYGFIHNGVLLANTSVRLEDVLADAPKFDGEISFSNFMDWLTIQCTELDYGKVALQNKGKSIYPEHLLTPGLSAGLRDLHNRRKIQLINLNDATDLWFLQSSLSHEIVDRVSHIRIGGIQGC